MLATFECYAICIVIMDALTYCFSQIPGRWEVFIDQLKVNALDDCVVFYESDMNVIQRQHNYGRYSKRYDTVR